MKAKTASLLLILILMLAVTASPLEAQGSVRTVGNRNPRSADAPRENDNTGSGDWNSGMQLPSQMFVTGRVLLEDGIALPEPATVEMVCGGSVRQQTFTFAEGGFSFQLGDEGSDPAMPVWGTNPTATIPSAEYRDRDQDPEPWILAIAVSEASWPGSSRMSSGWVSYDIWRTQTSAIWSCGAWTRCRD